MSQAEGLTIASRLTTWLLRKTITSGIRRVGDLPIAIASDIGLIRSQNEDRVAVARGRYPNGYPYVLSVVCDGMGGMAEGAVCASLAVGTFFAEFFARSQGGGAIEDMLIRSALEANNAVYTKYKGSGGTTLSAVLLGPDKSVYWLNVGDSRIYHFSEQVLFQLTKDDTIAGQLSERDPSFQGNTDLLQFIGIGPDIEPHVARFPTVPETKLLVTSDGVHYLQPDLMAKVVSHAPEMGLSVRRLIELSKWCGGHDNASALMISPDEYVELPVSPAELGVYEVWDPFGEVQFLKEGPTQHNTFTSKGQTPAPKISPQVGQEETKNSPSPDAIPKQKKTSKKNKSDKADQKQDAEDARLEKGEVPQLKIEFPNKN